MGEQIDMTAQLAALAALDDQEEWAVRMVLDAPGRFVPPVLYALATALFDAGHREDGAFWFYAAQVRTRFDANRCADPTAAAAADVLTAHHGPPINRWAFADPQRLRAIVERAVDWDRATPHDYDHRWINLHGMGAFTGDGAPSSLPAAEWDAIAEHTRVEYLQGLDAALRG